MTLTIIIYKYIDSKHNISTSTAAGILLLTKFLLEEEY